MPVDQAPPRFLTLEQVAEELSTTTAQIYALVRRGELPAIRLGGRGQWRVERGRLEEFISQLYSETEQYVKDNPLSGGDH
jgi:excisionase family DNA binding protein